MRHTIKYSNFLKKYLGGEMKNIVKIFCIISLFITNVVYADIKFWTTEVQPARMILLENNSTAFSSVCESNFSPFISASALYASIKSKADL